MPQYPIGRHALDLVPRGLVRVVRVILTDDSFQREFGLAQPRLQYRETIINTMFSYVCVCVWVTGLDLTSSLYSVMAFSFMPGLSLVHEMTVLSLIYRVVHASDRIQIELSSEATHSSIVLSSHDSIDLSDRVSDLVRLNNPTKMVRRNSCLCACEISNGLRLTSPAPGDGSESLTNNP